MTDADIDLLADAARAAGRIATRYHGRDPRTWEKDEGQGPVTEADLAVDAMLRGELCGARPAYGWLSEESEDDRSRLSAGHTFIVDPIDGTRAFIEGGRDWSHSIAVAERGRIVAAVVYLPMRDALYAAAAGRGATLNGAPIRASATRETRGASLLSNRAALESRHWRSGPPPVKRHFRSSIAYRLCLVAEGRFDAMVTLRPTWEWDIAAGSLIVTEAGGIVTDRSGGAPAFNSAMPQTDGLVAAGALHPALLAALR